MRSALILARTQRDFEAMENVYLRLNETLAPISRFAEAIALGEELCLSGPPELAACREFIWGTALSIESAYPVEAERHLRAAESLVLQRAPVGYASRLTLAMVKYQLASVMGQQGQTTQSVSLYWEALNLVRQDEAALDMLRHIMLYNDLAYQLHLLDDPAAASYAQAGIEIARENGSLAHLPYLFSTLGDIALAHEDLAQAERCFSEGLTIAEAVPVPERVAGLKANLGLVYRQRKQPEEAKKYLLDALARADQLGNRHLAVRIRIWLAPLYPSATAKTVLQEARQVAENSGFSRLLEEIAQLEQTLNLG